MFLGRCTTELCVLLFVGSILCVAADEICPRCGNVSVPFPLSTSSSCGRAEYRVVCNESRGVLELPASSGLYLIQSGSIDPLNRRLVISPTSLSNSSCTLTGAEATTGGLLLNESLSFRVTSSNTFFLLNCPSTIRNSPLNCSESSLCHRYIDQKATFCKSGLCCTIMGAGSITSLGTPRPGGSTSPAYCSAYETVVNLDPSLQPGSWNYGVELAWPQPTEAACLPSQGRGACSTNSACRLNASSNTYMCLCNDGYAWNSLLGVCSSTGKDRTPLILGLVIPGTAVLILLSLLLFYRQKKRAKAAAAAKAAQLMRDLMSGKGANIFSVKELRKATQNFSRESLLGSGGFGDVYKGTLADGTVVAIKAPKLGNIKGRDQVINEVSILSQVNHRNLVRLWGCSVDTEVPLLVYEYVPNGTLYDWLHGGMPGILAWKDRIRIAQQTAEGLAYLHSAALPPIYHRDVKSSNILLDELLNARVCDFGLSRLVEPDLSHVSTCAQGTIGYLDPEYYENYQLTDKSDVYSFGVVLLEMVTSEKAIDFHRDEDDVNLAIYVTSRSEKDALEEVVDQRLLPDDTVRMEDILLVAVLALNCLQESRNARPTMKEVAEQLGFISGAIVQGSP